MNGRLLNLVRCREGQCFFQRSRAHPPSGDDFHPPVRFEPVEQKNGRTEDYMYVTDEAGINACTQVQTVEFHGWGSCAGSVERPDRLIIDLDPGEGITFESVKAAAVQLRKSFRSIGLRSFPLLTGSKGVHVVVPLVPEAEWPEVRAFAKFFCSTLAKADPSRFTVALPKAERQGRIFLDFLRNQRTATAILPFSARARDGDPVAAPVSWAELEDVPNASAFTIADAEELKRRAKHLVTWGEGSQRLPSIG